MHVLKHIFEWYFGVPPADPGQGTAWNFTSRTPWPAGLPNGVVLLLGAAAVAFFVWIYRRDARSSGWPAKCALIALRLSAVALILLFLSELTLSIDRTGLPVVVVLIDDSASMDTEEQFLGKEAEGAARALILGLNDSRVTRMNLVKGILLREKGAFLRDLVERHKLRVYRFSETAVAADETHTECMTKEDVDALLPALSGMKADGNQTRPGPAVRKVLNDLRGAPPSAIVILSDGITSTTDADRLTTAADAARTRLVPIYAVGMGSEEATRDLELFDLLADEVAFVNDPVTFTAKLRSFGFAGKEVDVTLRKKDEPAILTTTRVKAPIDGQATKVELTFSPPEEGDFEFVVEVTPAPRETTVENNAKSRRVSVRQEKIRVLLADSLPRYEFRYLKHLLERDKTIELKTVLQEADVEYSAEDTTALDNFPVRKEDLFQFDAVILGDLNPGYLSEGVFENLREFVREAGGGLVVVAGPQFTPLALRGTTLESMLPVQLSTAKAPPADTPIVDGFRPDLTIEGRKSSSIFRFAESELESLQIFQRLPELYWLFEAPELKPGAMVFVERPSRGLDGAKLPVIAMQRFGAGKVLFHATDDLWRWRFRTGDTYYGRYWVQAIRFLSRSRLLGKDRGAELDTDRQDYRRGDTVHFRVRFFEDRLSPVENDGVTVIVERRGDAQKPVKLTRVPQTPSVFEGQLPGAGEGTYHAWVATPAFRDAPPARDFRVESTDRERQRRGLDRAELEQTARRTHGKYYSLWEASRLPEEIPAGQPVPLESQEPISLWNRWELLALFTALLTAEWLLRKRCRLA